MNRLGQANQPLSQFTVLETQNAEAARSRMGGIYGDALALVPLDRHGDFSLRLNAAPLGQLTLMSMLWGHGIRATMPCLDGCFDFVAALHGCGEVQIGKRAVDCAGECGVVMSPIHSLRVRVTEELIGFTVKLPAELAEAHVRALTGKDVSQRLDFTPEMQQTGSMAEAWRLVHYVAGELDGDSSLLQNPLVMERFSETLLTALLCSQPSNYSQWLHRDPQSAGPRWVREIEEYLEFHCDHPITARDIAEIAGVSMSAIYAGFGRHRGYTPLEFLKEIRLRRVRDALLAAPPGATVKETAARWGFSHLGRFSRDYGRRFGESPSTTLRRGSN